MSITLSTTVSRDWEVLSPNSFQNRLLLVIITKGDGTPLDASFISEEEIIEICIGQAHIHPLGVLLVLHDGISCFLSKYQGCELHTSVLLLDVTEFHDEAITVWTMALAEAHVTAFIKMWHLNPTTRDRGHALLPNNHLPVKKHRIVSTHSLETLTIVSFDSSYKISLKRSHSVD